MKRARSRPRLLILAGAILPHLLAVMAGAVDLAPTEPVVGLSLGGQQKAYPISTFAQTPVVNDEVGRLSVVVFYDRGSDYATAFFRLVAGEPLEFSGQAAGTVADDLTTATRWDMTTGKAISGNLAGLTLIPVPAKRQFYSEWLNRFPRSAVYQPQ